MSQSTGPPQGLNSIATTTDRLEALIGHIVNARLSAECYALIYQMAIRSPFQRLRYNMITAMWLTAQSGEMGLTEGERQALMEIDAANASLEIRRTAHSLFDMEVRQQLVLRFGGVVRDRWERARHKLVVKPLDETVSIGDAKHG